MAREHEPTLSLQLARAAQHERTLRFLDRNEEELALDYATVHRRALAFAGGLRERGLRPGERVALVLPTGPGFIDAFFGTLAAGGIPVPLYPPVRLGRLDEYHQRTAAMVTTSGARMVLTDRRVRRVLGPSIESTRPELGCVLVDDVDGEPGPLVDRSPDDVAFIQFSSGTTVAPKPVALTHRQILANVTRLLATFLNAYPEGPEDQHGGVSWLPLYHDMGLVGAVLVAVTHPGDLTLIPPEIFVTRPAIWLRAISRYRALISPAPNFAYALCTDRITDDEMEGVDLSSWRVALNGAEPVTPGVLTAFVERFSRWGLAPEALTPVYGLAEATLAVTFSDLKRPFRWSSFDRVRLSGDGVAEEIDGGHALVALGPPLPDFEVRITDPDERHNVLVEGQLGRVWVRGPSVMRGYFERDDLTAAAFDGDWLDTGDLGFLHGGELYLYGRAKDIIILNGKNHAPQDIEQALDGLPGVRTGCAAALGIVPDGGEGERLLVLVERRPSTEAGDDDAIAERVRRRISETSGLVPWRVEVLEPGTLPRTSSGKIRRREALTRYELATLDAPDRVSALRLLGAMARSQLALWRSGRGGGDA